MNHFRSGLYPYVITISLFYYHGFPFDCAIICYHYGISLKSWLVGGFNPSERILVNDSQWEGLSHILWKIKNVPNHQPDDASPWYRSPKKSIIIGLTSRGEVPKVLMTWEWNSDGMGERLGSWGFTMLSWRYLLDFMGIHWDFIRIYGDLLGYHEDHGDVMEIHLSEWDVICQFSGMNHRENEGLTNKPGLLR